MDGNERDGFRRMFKEGNRAAPMSKKPTNTVITEKGDKRFLLCRALAAII
jgi:hypothetical protein